MKVKLLNYTPLEVADIAISKCYDKPVYKELVKQQSRINKVANVSKHSSTIEHLNYSFDIDGISRAVLQELARHRIASYTVKSTRYTLKELKAEEPFYDEDKDIFFNGWEEASTRAKEYLVFTDIELVDRASVHALDLLRNCISKGIPNDIAKYCLPEAYKTALVMTINARSLQNLISLRTDKHALWEIQGLARAMYEEIPEEHKFLFEGLCK